MAACSCRTYNLRPRNSRPCYVTRNSDGSTESEADDLVGDPTWELEPYLDSDHRSSWSESSETSDGEQHASVENQRRGQDVKGQAETKTPKPASAEKRKNVRDRLETPSEPQRDSRKPTASPSPKVTVDVSPKMGPRGSKPQKSISLDFMASLASDVPHGHHRHPEATQFVRDFDTKKTLLVRHLFHLINNEVCMSKLPADFEIKFNDRMRRSAGFTYSKYTQKGDKVVRTARIELSTKVVDSAERLRDTLVHELCHAAAWVVDEDRSGHGPVWRSWVALARRHFPALPVISSCHAYEVACKYTYRCTACGYSFGRHSKSLDTRRKVCGRCRGTFECVLTAQLGRSAGAAPATPRAAAPFALFVKDNYGSVKEERSELKHAEIMRLLSQQFAAAKISQDGDKTPEDKDQGPNNVDKASSDRELRDNDENKDARS